MKKICLMAVKLLRKENADQWIQRSRFSHIQRSVPCGTLKYRIIYIYAPNSDLPEFFEALRQHIESSEHDHGIVCGDFNLTLNPRLDSYNYKYINNPKALSKVGKYY